VSLEKPKIIRTLAELRDKLESIKAAPPVVHPDMEAAIQAAKDVDNCMGTFQLADLHNVLGEVKFLDVDGKEMAPSKDGAIIERAFKRFLKEKLKHQQGL